MLLVLAVLAVRLVQLQGVSGTAYAEQAARQGAYKDVLLAPRGAIRDRDGAPLAMSIEGRAVFGEPQVIRKARCSPQATRPCAPDTIARALAPVLRLPVAELARKLALDKGWVELADGLDIEVGNEVRRLGLVGVGVAPEPRRIHPGGDLAANVVGFTNKQGQAGGGVELGWDAVLRGTPGEVRGRVDGRGRVIPDGQSTRVEPVPGRDVHLTLDRDIQWYAQQLVAATVREQQAVSGSAIVMDVRTGEVLAMATAPTFDPNAYQKAKPQRRNNPAISELYDPGSTNKVVVAAKALEEGVVQPEEVLSVPYSKRFGSKLVQDSHHHPTEDYTFNGVIITSSNVGTVQVAERLGKEKITQAMRDFGFGEKSGTGLPTEEPGLVLDPAEWSGSSMGTIPIGQGVSVTAMQMASVYQTIANDGVRVTPTLVKGAQRPEPKRVVSSATAEAMLPMLEGVVSGDGTAEKAMVPGYRIAGKTGTADRYVHPHYVQGSYTSSFSGFAPADAPRLVTSVVINGTGKKEYYGGVVAGPVFRKLMGFALQDLGVPPSGAPFTAPPIHPGADPAQDTSDDAADDPAAD